MKKYLLTVLSIILTLPVFAYEDSIITTNGKLSDIKIQYNDVIDVFPLITIMNDKNTLIVHPLKEGCTKFSVVKNEKEKYIFDVKVSDEGTVVEPVEGFDILVVDCPPNTYEYSFDLDVPPGAGVNLSGVNLSGVNTSGVNTSGVNASGVNASGINALEKDVRSYIKYIDEPPVLRGAN